MILLIVGVAAVVGLACYTSYKLGLLDRVTFGEATIDSQLIAIVAKSRAKDVGRHVERLLKVSKAVASSGPKGSSVVLAPGHLYDGVPADADQGLTVGLYLDNPNTSDHPRWALGWCVHVASMEEAKDLVRNCPNDTSANESLCAVRIGPGTCIRGRIPWRSSYTAWIAPMRWWGKAMHTYLAREEEKPIVVAPDRNLDDEPVYALHVYVTGKGDRLEFIDYAVMYGDHIKVTWSDLEPWP
jgi:hypothetical protein